MKKNGLHGLIDPNQLVECSDIISNNFQRDKKTILFIEPYGAALSLLKRGIEKEWNIILFTANTDLRIVPNSLLDSVNLAIKVDTANEETILALAQQLCQLFPLHAVIPGFEYFVPIAAKVSASLHLPGLHPDQVMQVRRKDLMRLTLQQAGVKIPFFQVIHCIDGMEKVVQEMDFPLVCKPVDAAGSVHVKKVDTKTQAMTCIRQFLEGEYQLWGHTLAKSMLIEEYVEGREFSLEGVVMQGVVTYFSMTEKIVFDQTEFIEIGHIVNPPLKPRLKQICEAYVEDVIFALGMNHCPFHAEIRLDVRGNPVLMEIAARLAGDKIGDLISLSRNVNYFDYVFAAYCGDILSQPPVTTQPVGIRFFYRPDVERFTKVKGIEVVKQYLVEEINLYYSPGMAIPAFPKPLRRLGHVIIKQDDYADLNKQLIQIDQAISFC